MKILGREVIGNGFTGVIVIDPPEDGSQCNHCAVIVDRAESKLMNRNDLLSSFYVRFKAGSLGPVGNDNPFCRRRNCQGNKPIPPSQDFDVDGKYRGPLL
jgi:hypothetical protein